MTVNEFEQQLGGFGESLQDITAILLQVAGPIVDDIKSRAPVDTGALKQSVQARVQGDSLFIEMIYYGMFQNFGVNGTEDRIANEVPFGVSERPLSEPFYAFKQRRFGLPARGFFDVDLITEIVADGVAQQLTEEF
mgnify:FL=1